MRSVDLPYFDAILEKLDREPDSPLATAFRKHVHWGYFASPGTADDSMEAYVVAAEALTSRICETARIADGLRILDVGCGFGGTISYLNERLSNCQLVGLNIDARQIERAKKSVHPLRGNSVEFVVGDACEMPFEGRSFNAILAVECIFHFPSRKKFFRDASKILEPGGRLALSDFVVRDGALSDLAAWIASNALPSSPFYGQSGGMAPTSSTYSRLARANSLVLLVDDDITANTLPTYAAMRRLYREAGLRDGETATDYLEATARARLLEYRILAFSRNERSRT